MKAASAPIPPFPLNTRTHTTRPPTSHLQDSPWAPPALSTAQLQARTSLSWWTAVACSAFSQPPSPPSGRPEGPLESCSSLHAPFTLTVVLVSVHGAQSDVCVSPGSACPDSCSPLHLLSPAPPLLGWPSCPLGRPFLTLLVSDQVSPLQRSTPPRPLSPHQTTPPKVIQSSHLFSQGVILFAAGSPGGITVPGTQYRNKI